jgi:hypothetical protein
MAPPAFISTVAARPVDRLDATLEVFCFDTGERPRKPGIIFHQGAIELEYVHGNASGHQGGRGWLRIHVASTRVELNLECFSLIG